ncbi:hypothetical protein HD806DRAFT_537938 [Xylariaceae sp. AK1471]|nr:hypothetical protein HD806DRAFT_537938 [Xylariaceae sp. AK1471]
MAQNGFDRSQHTTAPRPALATKPSPKALEMASASIGSPAGVPVITLVSARAYLGIENHEDKDTKAMGLKELRTARLLGDDQTRLRVCLTDQGSLGVALGMVIPVVAMHLTFNAVSWIMHSMLSPSAIA